MRVDKEKMRVNSGLEEWVEEADAFLANFGRNGRVSRVAHLRRSAIDDDIVVGFMENPSSENYPFYLYLIAARVDKPFSEQYDRLQADGPYQQVEDKGDSFECYSTFPGIAMVHTINPTISDEELIRELGVER